MGLHFDIVDVFTDRAYAGNPLAVVHRARTLTARQMQAIAAEFGLSETAFTLPPTTSRGDVPAADLHPGPRAAVRRTPEHRGGLGAGVRRHDPPRGRGAGVRRGAAAGARRRGPGRGWWPGAPEVGPDLDGAALAATVGLGADDLDPDAARGRRGGRGAVRLPAGADRTPWRGRCRTCRGGRGDGATRRGSRSWPWTARSRHGARHGCSARRSGVREDPATGLGGGRARGVPRRRGVLPTGRSVLTIAQGAEMGRPSALEVQVRIAGGVAAEVAVRGGVRMVAKGELLALPDA